MSVEPVSVEPVTRRGVLALGAGVLAAGLLPGCTSDPSPRPGPSADPPVPSPVDPDVALRRSATERERSLLAEYDVVLRALPELAPRLAPLRAQHAEHLRALEPAPTPSGTAASAAPSAGARAGAPAGAPAGASAGAGPVVPKPADAASALRRLTERERAVGDRHGRDCLAAGRVLAGLLASLSASELSHAAVLT